MSSLVQKRSLCDEMQKQVPDLWDIHVKDAVVILTCGILGWWNVVRIWSWQLYSKILKEQDIIPELLKTPSRIQCILLVIDDNTIIFSTNRQKYTKIYDCIG
jgi:hypothetical protein